MLNKIIRYYNQNRKRVWIAILVIVFAIVLLQALNHITKNKNGSSSNSTSDTAIYQPDKSLVTGGSVSKKTYEKQSTLIDKFIENCNEGKIEEAYSLLSDDCKSVLYPSLESFTNNYYKQVFTEKRDYSIENWAGNTYRVNMTHDLLATGKSNEGVVTRDYFTIVNKNNEDKLNINNFVGIDELNKEKKDEHLQVKVIKREKYIDYEIYEIYIKNIMDKTMMLDDLAKERTIYLEDGEEIRHVAYQNELDTSMLTLDSQISKTLRIKFANPYIQGRNIKSLTFSKACINNTLKDAFNNIRYEREYFSFNINL